MLRPYGFTHDLIDWQFRIDALRPGVDAAAQVLDLAEAGAGHQLDGAGRTSAALAEEDDLVGAVEFVQLPFQLPRGDLDGLRRDGEPKHDRVAHVNQPN